MPVALQVRTVCRCFGYHAACRNVTFTIGGVDCCWQLVRFAWSRAMVVFRVFCCAAHTLKLLRMIALLALHVERLAWSPLAFAWQLVRFAWRLACPAAHTL